MRDIRLRHAALTDVGRVRTRNEDAYLAEPEAGLFAVADGLGGHAAGEVASHMAVRSLAERLRGGGAEAAAIRDIVESAIEHANAAIRRQATAKRDLAGMGTTITALLFSTDGAYLVGHVGDSRAYLLRNGRLRRLTRDHTYVQEMVERGRLTDEQARLHPRSSMLTRALGIEDSVQVSLYDGRARPRDRFLLATDGLTGLVPEPELAGLLEGPATPDELAERLVDAANEAGGTDNVTVVVLEIADEPVDQ